MSLAVEPDLCYLNRVQSEMRNFHFVFSVADFLDLGETRFKI